MSEYERERLENIGRNNEVLRGLGLVPDRRVRAGAGAGGRGRGCREGAYQGYVRLRMTAEVTTSFNIV